MQSPWTLFREPVNSYTHWFGVIKAVVFSSVLLNLAYRSGLNLTAFFVFGISMVLLYLASASYHSFRVSEKTLQWLRKIDHSAIFLMIAGTYTPVVAFGTHGRLQISMLVAVWMMAFSGIALKLWTLKVQRWISTSLYLAMGWIALILVPQLLQQAHLGVLVWLIVGGVVYTLGGIVYGTKRFNPFPGVLGFHEVWHLFVLGGSTAHCIMMFYLIPLPVLGV
ncbi:MAG: hemolysin III family protein [Deinococcaceae bacterium]